MDNNLIFDFDFSEAVVIRERINNLEIGEVRAATYGEKPSVTARDDGDNYTLDFVLPLPDGTFNIDSEISDTSTNPVSNAAVKEYVDNSKTTLHPIYTSTSGCSSWSEPDLFAGYDLLICYACSANGNPPSCYCIPLRYLEDTLSSPMAVQVADNDVYTTFMFTRNGFYIDKYTGSATGRVCAIYGVTFK